jgi:hypothetical protein
MFGGYQSIIRRVTAISILKCTKQILFTIAHPYIPGFGPDAGHTSWQFDAAGNVTQPGDIIFTAEFGTSGLAMLEARVWVNKNALLSTPANFNWGAI